ncbi:MAG TPA: heme ABC transporter ATP-binding protein [Nevskiaceae bacterium]|nr:heme ABC transporter ATP-binding protein [Nevskiaceae bacterium]
MNTRPKGPGLNAHAVHLPGPVRPRLQAVDLSLAPGEVLALIGPNGAGKSSLLGLLAGDRPPQAGAIWLDGAPLSSYDDREQAQRRAVMRQGDGLGFAFRVEEVVALGLQVRALPDRGARAAALDQALQAADAQSLRGRLYTQLSAGERMRVRFARALAQLGEAPRSRPAYLLMDEPTAALDLAHQHQLLAMCRCLAAGGVGVLVILHDLALAASYADRVCLLHEGRCVASGSPRQALTRTILSEVYGLPVALDWSAGGAPRLQVQPPFMPRA